ncbi:MAG TPA: cation:proton antiporter [Bacilli bacterium]|nr:cation:proton antiporter [Bacilli bacterium]HPS19305.1 cation:proton antiporter [Bacilli bacterium]
MLQQLGILLPLILAMFFGLLATRLMKPLGLPNVTGFLIAGVLIGPFLLGKWLPDFFLDADDVKSFGIITEIALGFIAFSIGTSFKKETLKSAGKSIIIITIFEGLGALFITLIALLLVYFFVPGIPLPVVITLGAIATATAPAATLMVVRQYRAKGPVTNTLLPVVALDDAVALMSFAICFPVAEALASGRAITIIEVLLIPLAEIVISLGIGTAVGFLLTLAMRWFHSRANRLSLMIVSVLLVVMLARIKVGSYEATISSLLACMMIGTILVNARADGEQILEGVERWTPPLFMLFFVISGASLDLSVFFKGGLILIVAGVYIVFRMVGKFFGSFLGGKITKAEPKVQKYLGWALFPQAGVAIGMATLASQGFPTNPEYGAMILAVALAATLVYELVGPIITKIALTKAGEIIIEKKKPKAIVNKP